VISTSYGGGVKSLTQDISPKSLFSRKRDRRKKHAGLPQPDLTYEEAVYLAWQRGLLQYKLLPHQHGLFDIISNPRRRKTVINCSRRFGKTTVLLIYCLIFAIRNSDSLIRFVAPTQKTLRKNIFPIIRNLLKDCPSEFLPKWDTVEGCYRFPNGSEIHIYGTDQQNHDSLRGQRTDLGVVDEAAYCSDLMYVITDILLPQTLTCEGYILIASTPNKRSNQSSEEFRELCTEAEMTGAYHTKTIYDNTSLSKTKIKEYADEAGGESSVTFQVEYLCKFMIDPEKRIVPEWDTDKFVIAIPSPQHYGFYHKYVAMDLGVKRDFTCILFAYYDFQRAAIVILDEEKMKNMNSHTLVKAMKGKEELYFTNGQVYRRVSDTDNPLLLNDLCSLHQLPIISTSKTTLEAMVNEMRVWISDGRVIVHPRCKYLIQCLEKGVWASNMQGMQRRDFGRTESLGHFDGLAALNYLIRNIDTTTNPIPSHLGYNDANSFISGQDPNTHKYKDFKQALTKKTFRR
jgi:hypothetical protein